MTLLLAAPSVGWLDGGELVAGAWDLGVSHPPGQPLPTLIWRLAMLVPFASIPFRANLVSAICLGLACWPLVRLAGSLVGDGSAGMRRFLPWLVGLPALLGVAPVAQAVRTEVYALQLLLALGVVAAAVACHRGEPAERRRATLAVVFLLGLSGATHPLLAVALVPAALLGLAGAVTSLDLRSAGLAGLAAVLALGLQLYLPLRSAARPELAWGMPHTPEAFLAVLSGKAFAQNFSPSDGGMIGHNLGVVVQVVAGGSGLALTVLGVLGLVALLLRGRRVIPAILLLAVAGNVATILFQNKVFATNPDLLGYLCLTTALVGLLGGVALVVALDRLAGAPWFRHPQAVAGVVAVALALTLVPGLWSGDLSRNFEPERLARSHQDGLPPGATLITSGNSSAFVGLYLSRVERRRPDLAVFHRILLGHPFYERQLRAQLGDPPAGVDTRALRGSAMAALEGRAGTVAVEIREPDLSHAEDLVPAGRVMLLGEGGADLDVALRRHEVLAARWEPDFDAPEFPRDLECQGLWLYERLLRASYFRERSRPALLDRELAAASLLAPGQPLPIPEPADDRWWRAP